MADPADSNRWREVQLTLAGLERRLAVVESAIGAKPSTDRPDAAAPAAAEPLLPFDAAARAATANTPAETPSSMAEASAGPAAAPGQAGRPLVVGAIDDILLNAGSRPGRTGKVVAAARAPQPSLEELIGGRWFTWLGAGALALAVAYFVPWAWRHFAMPPWFRVLVFHLAGLGMLGAAWALSRKRLAVLAHGIAGLGVFTLYASAFAMEYHYRLWGDQGLAATLLDCGLITLAAIVIAVRYDSVYIVLLGALGGYVTPLIATRGITGFTATFSYLAFLNATLVVTASIRPWRFLKPLALVATALMFQIWFAGDEWRTAVWQHQWMVALHFALFIVGTTAPPLVWRQRSEGPDLAALAGNSLWFVYATWLLFHQRLDQQMALVCWGMSLLHGVLFAVAHARLTNADRMPRFHLALAAAFFTLAVPLQMHDSLAYLAYAWAVQGFVFTAIGVYFRDRQMTASGALVLMLSLLRAGMYDFLSAPQLVGDSAIDRRMLVMLGVGAAMIAAGSCAWWVARLSPQRDQEKSEFDEQSRREGAMLAAVGNVVAMIGLTCQWSDRTVLWLWIADAALLWAAALYRGRLPLRMYALAVSLVMVGGRVLYHGVDLAAPFTLATNERFLSLAAVAGLYLTAGWFERRRRRQEQSAGPTPRAAGETLYPVPLPPDAVLHILGHAVMFAALLLEVHDSFRPTADALAFGRSAISMEEHMTYSFVACVYAAILVAGGFVSKYRLPRLLGLGGLMAVGLKVLAVDLAELELIYRVLILAALGALMLVTSFWYQKFTARLGIGASDD